MNSFTLEAVPGNKKKISLLITDVTGREVAQWNSVSVNEDFNFGNEFSKGFYFAEVTQGGHRKIIRLIKN
jgi:hypothetical protein